MPSQHLISVARGIALLLAGLLLTGCSTIDEIFFSDAKVDFKRNYDFDYIQSVSVACGMDLESEDMPVSLAEVDSINQALARAIEQQGLTVVGDPATADARVSWHVVVEEQSNVREYNAQAYYQCWRCGPAISSSSQVTYTEGTFIVDIIDPGLSQSVWRGVIQGRLPDVGSAEVEQKRFDAIATEMFDRFPPTVLFDGF